VLTERLAKAFGTVELLQSIDCDLHYCTRVSKSACCSCVGSYRVTRFADVMFGIVPLTKLLLMSLYLQYAHACVGYSSYRTDSPSKLNGGIVLINDRPLKRLHFLRHIGKRYDYISLTDRYKSNTVGIVAGLHVTRVGLKMMMSLFPGPMQITPGSQRSRVRFARHVNVEFDWHSPLSCEKLIEDERSAKCSRSGSASASR
jgi:hypothetical protein